MKSRESKFVIQRRGRKDPIFSRVHLTASLESYNWSPSKMSNSSANANSSLSPSGFFWKIASHRFSDYPFARSGRRPTGRGSRGTHSSGIALLCIALVTEWMGHFSRVSNVCRLSFLWLGELWIVMPWNFKVQACGKLRSTCVSRKALAADQVYRAARVAWAGCSSWCACATEPYLLLRWIVYHSASQFSRNQTTRSQVFEAQSTTPRVHERMQLPLFDESNYLNFD
jgi:hypothetical protein